MEIPQLSKPDMYKFLMSTLLQNNFTLLSTETISEIGAKITTHNKQFLCLPSLSNISLNEMHCLSSFTGLIIKEIHHMEENG